MKNWFCNQTDGKTEQQSLLPAFTETTSTVKALNLLYSYSTDFKRKPYLDVDEVLALLDHVDVGVVYGLLVVFNAGGPVGG